MPPDGGSCFRTELGGLDILKRRALEWRRVSALAGKSWVNYAATACPRFPQEYRKNCKGLLGAWPGVADWPFASWIWLSDVFCLACTVF